MRNSKAAEARVCIICGQEFTPALKSAAKTCSRDCWIELVRRNSLNQPHRPRKVRVFTCAFCGKVFETDAPGTHRTCSPDCARKQHSKKIKEAAAAHRAEHYLTKTCPICGKVFETQRGRNRTYCSRACGSKREIPKNSEICVICGRKFFAPKSANRKTCSQQCWKEFLSRSAKQQDLTAMREGAKYCPILQSTPQHFRAKEWALRAPDGTEYRFKNLNHFVRTHKELFPPELLREHHCTPFIATRLSALAPWRQAKRAKQALSVLGWTWAD